jgi:hypothetical protein
MSFNQRSTDTTHTSRRERSDGDEPGPGKQTLTAGLPVTGPDGGAAGSGGAQGAGDREAVQLEEVRGGKPAGSCDIPFPKTQNAGPDGTVCRRFEGVTTYKDISEARLVAAGYKFWTSDGSFDKWVKVDGSTELWLQLPRINAATSQKAIGQLRSIVATRRAQLDEIGTLAKLTDNPDPDVAQAAREELKDRLDEFPGFDEDYAQVPQMRAQVDADHRKAFEDQVKALMEERDRYDPQSTYP